MAMPNYSDEAIDRRALLAQMSGGRQNPGNTGVVGPGVNPANAVPPPPPVEAPVPNAVAEPTPPGVDPGARSSAREALLRNGFGGQNETGLKLDDAAHGKKSPKYALAQTAMDMGLQGKTEDLPKLLAELQKRDPRYAGFSVGGGKGDRLVYGGDKAALDPAFEGVSEIDAILAAGEGGKGFAYQPVGGPEGQQPIDNGGVMMNQPGQVQGIQSLVPTDTNAYNTLQNKLKQLLGAGDPQAFDREALLSQMTKR